MMCSWKSSQSSPMCSQAYLQNEGMSGVLGIGSHNQDPFGIFWNMIPRHSMSVIYAYIEPSNHPNVDKYTIHRVFWIWTCFVGLAASALLMAFW